MLVFFHLGSASANALTFVMFASALGLQCYHNGIYPIVLCALCVYFCIWYCHASEALVMWDMLQFCLELHPPADCLGCSGVSALDVHLARAEHLVAVVWVKLSSTLTQVIPPHSRLPSPKIKTPNPSPQQGPQTTPHEDLLTCHAQQIYGITWPVSSHPQFHWALLLVHLSSSSPTDFTFQTVWVVLCLLVPVCNTLP